MRKLSTTNKLQILFGGFSVIGFGLSVWSFAFPNLKAVLPIAKQAVTGEIISQTTTIGLGDIGVPLLLISSVLLLVSLVKGRG